MGLSHIVFSPCGLYIQKLLLPFQLWKIHSQEFLKFVNPFNQLFQAKISIPQGKYFIGEYHVGGRPHQRASFGEANGEMGKLTKRNEQSNLENPEMLPIRNWAEIGVLWSLWIRYSAGPIMPTLGARSQPFSSLWKKEWIFTQIPQWNELGCPRCFRA